MYSVLSIFLNIDTTLYKKTRGTRKESRGCLINHISVLFFRPQSGPIHSLSINTTVSTCLVRGKRPTGVSRTGAYPSSLASRAAVAGSQLTITIREGASVRTTDNVSGEQRAFTRAARSAGLRFAVIALSKTVDVGRDHLIHRKRSPFPYEGKDLTRLKLRRDCECRARLFPTRGERSFAAQPAGRSPTPAGVGWRGSPLRTITGADSGF